MSVTIRNQIVREVAEAMSVDAAAIMSSSTARPVARARQEVYCRLRARGWSMNRIGILMGRDHTTVSHGVRRAQA